MSVRKLYIDIMKCQACYHSNMAEWKLSKAPLEGSMAVLIRA